MYFFSLFSQLVVDVVIADNLFVHQHLHIFKIMYYFLLQLLLRQITVEFNFIFLQPSLIFAYLFLQLSNSFEFGCSSTFLLNAGDHFFVE